MRKIILVIVLLVLPLLCFAQDAIIQTSPQNDVVEIILVENTIKLYKPIIVEEATMYEDGGTISITLKDINGTTFSFFLPQVDVMPDFLVQVGEYKNTGIHGTQEIIKGSKGEKVILSILEDWVSESVPEETKRATQETIHEIDIKYPHDKRVDAYWRYHAVLRAIYELRKRG